ncbi:MAG: squalene/phytoene synthase family protein [Anaerolineales bacterium]
MQEEYKMLRAVSRTFALSIEQLPQPLRDAITLAYLLFRVSDCLEDHESLSAPEKAELLRLWAAILAGDQPVDSLSDRIQHLDDSDPEVYVAQKAGQILERVNQLPSDLRQPIVERVIRSSLGMARWQEHGPYVEDEAALDDYMHQVAGRVGYLLTDVFSWYSPFIRQRKDQLMPLSRECGLALQTVNIIRGMRKDYERGWVFVPQSYYERYGLTRESLFDPKNLDRSMQVVELLAQKAERHLWGGLSYVMHLPRRFHRIRLACMWPVYLAVGTLTVSRNNAKVIMDEAKLGRDQVFQILTQTRMFGWSNHWLHFYFRQLADPPQSALGPFKNLLIALEGSAGP